VSTKANPLPAPSLTEMPRDGTPVTYSATYARQVGQSPLSPVEADEISVADDYEHCDWEVHRQTVEGWRFIDNYEGRPYDPDLRDSYGPGRYKVIPTDRQGKPVKRLSEVRTIGTPNKDLAGDAPSKAAAPAPLAPAGQGLSPWLQFQAQQMAEERREARRRAEEAEQRREERIQRERDYERARREQAEEDRRERMEREDRMASVRQEQQNQMIAQIAGVVQAGLAAFANRPPAADLNEGLLTAMLADRGRKGNDATNIRETMELLMVLDQLAESRKPEPKEEEGGLGNTMASLLPLMMAMKGGGVPPAALSALPTPPPSGVPSELLTDPAAISMAASANPQAVAQALVAAVKSNPQLENAVVEAFTSDDGGDHG